MQSPTKRLACALHTRRRLLLLLATSALAYRHRRLLSRYFSRATLAARRFAAATEHFTAAASIVSADFAEYLHPQTAPTSAYASRHSESARDGAFVESAASPPRSLQRLLRIAASADALVVLRAVAGSAARELVGGGVCAGGGDGVGDVDEDEDVGSDVSAASGQVSASFSPVRPRGKTPMGSAIESVVAALDTPAGARVAGLLVGTAVREAVTTVVDHQQSVAERAAERAAERGETARIDGSGAKEERHWLDVLLTAGLSDRGRVVLVDLATAITRAAVPALVTAQQEQQQQEQQAQNQTPVQGVETSNMFKTPTGTPARRPRPTSVSSSTAAALGSASVSNAGLTGSPASKQLLLTMLAMNSKANWMDRLAVLASRDRGLVRDVVRTVASEAIRAYLTTQAELHLAPSAVPRASGSREVAGQEPYTESGRAMPSQVAADTSVASSLSARRQSMPASRPLGSDDIGTLLGSSKAAVGTTRSGEDAVRDARASAGRGRTGQTQGGSISLASVDSVARMLLKSVAGDIRQSIRDYMHAPPSPQWFFM